MIAKVKKNPTDPIAIIIGGIIETLAILGIPDKLGLDATQVAQLGGVLIMIAGAIRFILTKHDKGSPVAQAPAPESEQTTVEASSDDQEDADGIPAEDDDESETPVVGPPPSVGG